MSAYISEAIKLDSLQLGTFNLIVAPCGAGKTTAAFETIPKYLGVSPHRSLILIDTKAGADSFVLDGKAQFYDSVEGQEWYVIWHHPEELKPSVMTYALFGALMKKNAIQLSDFDYIICDEIHSLNSYIAMSRGKLRKQYPQAATWEINDMLQMTCFTYNALETIWKILKEGRIWVIGMTATSEELHRHDLKILDKFINEVKFSQQLHAYEIISQFDYVDIEQILRACVPDNHKRLFYFSTIKELQTYKQILMECGRAAESLWSPVADEKMNEHQYTTREYILHEHRFPPDISDLLINNAYETSISIKDESVKEAYIHTSNPTARVQARGRLRQNLERVGYYNKTLKHDKTHNENRREKILNQELDIPLCFINIPLRAEEKEELIQLNNFKQRWPTFKKALEKQGYIVLDKNSKQGRYSVIQFSEEQKSHDTCNQTAN